MLALTRPTAAAAATVDSGAAVWQQRDISSPLLERAADAFSGRCFCKRNSAFADGRLERLC